MDDVDTASLLFSFPDDIFISSIRTTMTQVMLHIASRRPCATCPLCEQPSERVHGRYARTVADLPCAGRRVILALTVRKFVCTTPACPPPSSVRILGVDDWAWKKGQTYGTILVDLEKHCAIELLPDRKEETLTAWLRTHQEIEVISRDRAGEYAAAAKKGAPQAQQIADKFHLVKNLREGLKELMARKQKVLPEVAEVTSGDMPLRAQGQPQESARSGLPEPEAKALGYTGSQALFRLFMASLRKHHQTAVTQPV